MKEKKPVYFDLLTPGWSQVKKIMISGWLIAALLLLNQFKAKLQEYILILLLFYDIFLYLYFTPVRPLCAFYNIIP